MNENKLPDFRNKQKKNIQEILALEGQYSIDSLTHEIVCCLYEKEDNGELSNEEMMVVTMASLANEIYNGGIDQFFLNKSYLNPQKYPELAVEACLAIGKPACADVYKRALNVLNISLPTTTETIGSAYNDLLDDDKLYPIAADKFNELDDEFCKDYDSDNNLFEYIKKNIK